MRRDTNLVSEIKWRIEPAEAIRRIRYSVWNNNLFALLNRINTEVMGDTVRLVDTDKKREYLPVNLILKVLQSRIASLLSFPLEFVVDPGSLEFGDEAAAMYAEKVLNGVFVPKLEEVIDDWLLWTLLCDRTLVKIHWDKNLGDWVDELAEKNGLVVKTGRKIKEGDVRLSVLSPFDYLIDPNAIGHDVLSPESEHQARWFVHEKVVSEEHLREIYQIPETELQYIPRYNQLPDVQLEILRYKGLSLPERNNIRIMEFWELPSSKYPEGRLITFVPDTNIILQSTTLPNPVLKLNSLPLVELVDIVVPFSFYGLTTTENIRFLSTTFSKELSHIADLAKDVGTKTIVLPGPGKVAIQPIEDTPLGDYVITSSTAQQPQIVRSDDFPFPLLRVMDMLLAVVEMVAGTTDVKYPMRVRTATEILRAEEQDTTRIAPLKKRFRAALERAALIFLEFIREYYTPKRKLEITGPGGETEIIEFNRSKLGKKFNIRIKAGGLAFGSKYSKLLFLQQIAPAVQLVTSDPQYRTQITATIAQTIQDILEVQYQDRSSARYDTRNAERENAEFARDPNAEIPTQEFDNHQNHIEIHTRFLMANFLDKNLSAIQTANIKKHIREHKAALQAEMATLAATLQQQGTQQQLPAEQKSGETSALKEGGG